LARKFLFQVHLWTGLGLGLYILVISVSGSAVVFRNELLRVFAQPPPVFTGPGDRMTPEQIEASAKRSFPDHDVDRVLPGQDPDQAVLVWFVRGSDRVQHFFHPYTGEDLGHALTPGYRAVSWLIDLHDNLLYGLAGRRVNGIGAILTTLLCLTGAVIWWPGTRKWRRSLLLDWKAKGSLFHWSLHSMLGFWLFALLLLWGVSGIYLAFPNPFDNLLERLDPIDQAEAVPRLGDTILYWLTRIHFGRWGGYLTKTLWTLFGLVPAALFVTGAYMWWCRVLRPTLDSRNPHAPVSTEHVSLEPKTPLTGTPA
jgi:uncharacterized iron-regulated membrane protein